MQQEPTIQDAAALARMTFRPVVVSDRRSLVAWADAQAQFYPHQALSDTLFVPTQGLSPAFWSAVGSSDHLRRQRERLAGPDVPVDTDVASELSAHVTLLFADK